MLLQVPSITVSPTTATAANVIAVAVLLGLKEVFVDRKGRNRRAVKSDRALDGRFRGLELVIDANARTSDERHSTVLGEIRTLSGHVIGPDGQNGLRGDIREIKERVRGLENRERDGLLRPRDVGALDRRGS